MILCFRARALKRNGSTHSIVHLADHQGRGYQTDLDEYRLNHSGFNSFSVHELSSTASIIRTSIISELVLHYRYPHFLKVCNKYLLQWRTQDKNIWIYFQMDPGGRSTRGLRRGVGKGCVDPKSKTVASGIY